MSKPKPHGPVGEHFMRHYYGAAKAAPQRTADSKLPPLPHHGFLDDEIMVYTRQQILDYGAACRAAALEEAAKVCDKEADTDGVGAWARKRAQLCAAAIRAMKDGK